MAKKHLREFARILADKYEKVNDEVLRLGTLVESLILVQSDYEQYQTHQKIVANELADISVALSAASQAKLYELVAQSKSRLDSAQERAARLQKELSDKSMPDDVKEKTQALADSTYRELLALTAESRLLSLIGKIAYLPSSKKKLGKLFAKQAPLPIDKRVSAYIREIADSLFVPVDADLAHFHLWVTDISMPTVGTAAGVLDE